MSSTRCNLWLAHLIVIPLDDRLPFVLSAVANWKKGILALTIAEDEGLYAFWPMLEENLRTIRCLSRTFLWGLPSAIQFPRQISLFRVCDGAETLGGCIVYETDSSPRAIHRSFPTRKEMRCARPAFHQLIYDRYAQSDTSTLASTDTADKYWHGITLPKGFGAKQ